MPSIQVRRASRHQDLQVLTVRGSIKGRLVGTTKLSSFDISVFDQLLFTMSLKPVEIWAHWGAPNPWKVCMILEALNLPYSLHYLEFSEVKTEQYLELTPNGRLPTIQDPNTGLTLWEVSQ